MGWLLSTYGHSGSKATCSRCPVFRDMFTLPAGTALTEGDADDTPVRLEGVKQDDFKALLHVMFRP